MPSSRKQITEIKGEGMITGYYSVEGFVTQRKIAESSTHLYGLSNVMASLLLF